MLRALKHPLTQLISMWMLRQLFNFASRPPRIDIGRSISVRTMRDNKIQLNRDHCRPHSAQWHHSLHSNYSTPRSMLEERLKIQAVGFLSEIAESLCHITKPDRLHCHTSHINSRTEGAIRGRLSVSQHCRGHDRGSGAVPVKV